MDIFKAHIRKNVQVLVTNEAMNVPTEHRASAAVHEVHGQLVGYEDTHPALEILTDTGEINIINWYHVVSVIVEA